MASLNPWFLMDMARFKSERDGLTELATREDWLTLKDMRFDGGQVVVDIDLDIGHRVFEAVLRYPATFPHSPPSVRPRDGVALWSGHQFGAGGDLCLEYRPDNWLPELTGWQMVESAYRLLHGENPQANQREQVASAHRLTEGQRLRTKYSRIPLSRSLIEKFTTIAPGQAVHGTSVLYLTEGNLIRIITSLEPDGEPAWQDPEVPSLLSAETWDPKVYVRRLAPGEAFPSTESYEVFATTAEALGWTPAERSVVFLQEEQVRGYSVFDDAVYAMEPIFPPKEALRLSPEHARLKDARVAILGCGSVGSKIAVMLARAGVERFVLVDDDILMSDNLVRHELDWRDVGLHKARALANRLRRIRPSLTVSIRCQQLAGQDSPEAAENILNRIAECDLIVDATANPAVSNIMSSFTHTARIPLVWAEVFAGGVGGIIARHRPGVEPTISLMRRAIENWFAQRVTASPPQAAPYELVADGTPLIADDADVTSIAASAARLAIDTLLQRAPSHFPYSIYVMGLAPCDLFDAPFETYPIDLPAPPAVPTMPQLSAEEATEQLVFLAGLMQAAKQSA